MLSLISHHRRINPGLLPFCVALCLMVPSYSDAAVITSDLSVNSVDLMNGQISSPELRVWHSKVGHAVESGSNNLFRGRLLVDVSFLAGYSDFGDLIRLLAVGVGDHQLPLNTSSSSSATDLGSGPHLMFCGHGVFVLSPSCVAAWLRMMRLGSLPTVPPDELLKPPRA